MADPLITTTTTATATATATATTENPVVSVERWATLRGRSALVVVGCVATAAARDFADRVVDGSALPLPTDARDPRQADVLIVVGRVSHKLAPHLVELFQALPDDARVIAFDDDDDDVYAVARADSVVDVDVLVRGLPPDEGTLQRALVALFGARP